MRNWKNLMAEFAFARFGVTEVFANDRRARRSRPCQNLEFRLWFLPGDVEIGWKGRAGTHNAARSMRRIGFTDFRRRRRKWLLAFGFERVV